MTGEKTDGLCCGSCDLVTQEAARTGEPVHLIGRPNPDFPQCQWRAFAGQSGEHSVLAVPLKYGDETLGALTVFVLGSRPFAPDQIKLLGTLASLAVAAVRNAQSYAYEQNIAETLQKAFLPGAPTRMPGLDIAEKYYPTRVEEAQIGGDYYDFVPLGPQKLAFIIGDISGKGLAAAVYTAMAKYTLRAFAAQDMPPGEVVARANRAIARHTVGEIFSTLFYGVLDLKTGTLAYVNAGHEPPQLARASGEVLSLEPTGMMLGAFPDAEFEEAECIRRRSLIRPPATCWPSSPTACRTPAPPTARSSARPASAPNCSPPAPGTPPPSPLTPCTAPRASPSRRPPAGCADRHTPWLVRQKPCVGRAGTPLQAPRRQQLTQPLKALRVAGAQAQRADDAGGGRAVGDQRAGVAVHGAGKEAPGPRDRLPSFPVHDGVPVGVHLVHVVTLRARHAVGLELRVQYPGCRRPRSPSLLAPGSPPPRSGGDQEEAAASDAVPLPFRGRWRPRRAGGGLGLNRHVRLHRPRERPDALRVGPVVEQCQPTAIRGRQSQRGTLCP